MSKLQNIFRSLRNCRRCIAPLASASATKTTRSFQTYSRTRAAAKLDNEITPVITVESEEEKYEENVKSNILEHALQFVTKTGWSVESLSAGAEAAGYPGVTHGLFPKGGGDLVHYFNVKCNEQLVTEMKSWPLEDLKDSKVPAKFVENAIMTRLHMIEPYKSTWAKALAIQALPSNVPNCLATLLSLVDDICYHSGDRSVDFNWYIRRVGLAAIYKSCELYYLADSGAGAGAGGTRAFVAARLRDARLVQAALQANPAAVAPQTLQAAFVTAKNILGINPINTPK